MKKDAKEILFYDIVPDVGLGEIHFGMTKDEILEKYNIKEYIASGECIISGNKMTYYNLFSKSITFGFNSNLFLINITVQNQFKGKYLNQITIGSPFVDLYELTKDIIHFDDDLFFIGEGYNFQIELDTDECSERLGYDTSDFLLYYDEGKIDSCKIEQIAIQKDI